MADTSLWMFTSEYEWLHKYVQMLRKNAIDEMVDGASPERYAELRGYIQGCDHVIAAPERYIAEKAREQNAQNV